MADVYLARRCSGPIEKRVVIKRVRRDRVGELRSLEGLIREARLSMSLAHQNIVAVFDFGRVGDDVFLVMEHVEGHDLAATWARPGAAPMPALCAAYVGLQGALALDHAHHRAGADGEPLGLVHCDVTPRNLLVSAAGEVKLADFGVAGLAGEPIAGLRGTPAYMAPEQARREPVDARADLYALGLVLWEALTGRRARSGATVDDVLALARAGAPPGPAPVDLPPALAQVIARATTPRVDERYRTARAMAAELDAYLVAARADAPGPTLAQRLAAWYAAAWGDVAPSLIPVADDELRALGRADGEGSMAATADDGDAGPVEVRSVAPPPPPEAETPAARSPAGPSTAAPARRRRWFAAAAVAAMIAVGLTAGMAAQLAGRGRPASPSGEGAPVADRPPVAATPAASGPAATTATTATAPPRPVPPAAEPLVATATPRKATRAGRGAPTVVRPAAALAPATRAVVVGATPWADFTIDDAAEVHQTPETVRLSPGRHTLHFVNPVLGVHVDRVIEVPADRDLRHLERLP